MAPSTETLKTLVHCYISTSSTNPIYEGRKPKLTSVDPMDAALGQFMPAGRMRGSAPGALRGEDNAAGLGLTPILSRRRQDPCPKSGNLILTRAEPAWLAHRTHPVRSS